MMYEIKIKNNGNKTCCPHRENTSPGFGVEFPPPPNILCHVAQLQPKILSIYFIFKKRKWTLKCSRLGQERTVSPGPFHKSLSPLESPELFAGMPVPLEDTPCCLTSLVSPSCRLSCLLFSPVFSNPFLLDTFLQQERWRPALSGCLHPQPKGPAVWSSRAEADWKPQSVTSSCHEDPQVLFEVAKTFLAFQGLLLTPVSAEITETFVWISPSLWVARGWRTEEDG